MLHRDTLIRSLKRYQSVARSAVDLHFICPEEKRVSRSLCLWVAESERSADSEQLLSRLISALEKENWKVSHHWVNSVDIDSTDDYSILFGNLPSKGLRHFLKTYSLSEMISQPSLRKELWTKVAAMSRTA